MYVKMIDGRFAGEVKDLRSDVALEFLRQGRAVRAFADAPPRAIETAPVAPIEGAAAPQPRQQRRGRR